MAEGTAQKLKAIICDLDGTLCNTAHRQIDAQKSNWKDFYTKIPLDPVHSWCKKILELFGKEGYIIILVTGRPFSPQIRDDTFEWLRKNNIRYDVLLSRIDKDNRRDEIVKKEIYDNEIAPFYDVLFAIDDRKRVVDMWRSIGLTCLQCTEGNF